MFSIVRRQGEGIYFAAKSGRMCAETIVKNSKQGVRMIDEAREGVTQNFTPGGVAMEA